LRLDRDAQVLVVLDGVPSWIENCFVEVANEAQCRG